MESHAVLFLFLSTSNHFPRHNFLPSHLSNHGLMIDALLKGIAIGFLLIFSVGPIVFTIIKQSLNNGKSGGFSFVAGVWLSDLLWIILSNAFSTLVTELLHFKKPIGITGSFFLIAMGIFYVFFKKITLRNEEEQETKISTGTHAKLFASGFLINTLNPAVIAFWLTTATTIAVSNSINERIVIFTTCLGINMCTDIFKVTMAGKLRNKLTDHNIALINKISGSLLIVFGVALLVGIIYSTTQY
jgi:threonine/homoserine/homoserine lactone efflux protein